MTHCGSLSAAWPSLLRKASDRSKDPVANKAANGAEIAPPRRSTGENDPRAATLPTVRVSALRVWAGGMMCEGFLA